MVIMIAGTIRSDEVHIQLVFCECHETVYAVINQVALLEMHLITWQLTGSHCHWARKQACTKIPYLCSWKVQLLPLQILSMSHLLTGA